MPASDITAAAQLADKVDADLPVLLGGDSLVDTAKWVARALSGASGQVIPRIELSTPR